MPQSRWLSSGGRYALDVLNSADELEIVHVQRMGRWQRLCKALTMSLSGKARRKKLRRTAPNKIESWQLCRLALAADNEYS